MIRHLSPEFRPASFSVDFELAAIQALKETFPASVIAGCFYHLMRNFKKCLASNGLIVRYRDPEFLIQARMIVSLVFVPPLDVWNCLAQIKAYLPAELSPVLNYFSHYYIGTLMDPPMFPVNMWSCYDRTLEGEDRTNNYAETLHRRMQDALVVEHPTVGRLLHDLKRIQRTHDFHCEQYLAGIAAPRKRIIYREADARILGRVQRYHQTNIIQYLRGLAHNFVMDQ